ncbi:MAG: hypothetical protein ACJ71K_05085 [Nitrososphaeraceae archaeon]
MRTSIDDGPHVWCAFRVRSMNDIFSLDHAEEVYELMMSGKVLFRSVLTTGKIWPG